LFLNPVEHASKITYNYKDFKSLLIFSLALEDVEFLIICDFSLNKSCKTYLGTMLPLGS
jgi:hypothetical protein